MKRFFAILFFAALCPAVSAQEIGAVRAALASSADSTRTSVVVREVGDAASAVAEAQQTAVREKVRGWRVGIFFGNGQDARAQAEQIRHDFREMFPDVATYIVYENPYWKVKVGNCLSEEEAIILWGRVKRSFDRAVVMVEEIPLEELSSEAEAPAAAEPVERE
ncbi:MAG: hypothetical protein J6K95_08860 [Rikenellaceae bacterium]|nr:hypothetical protein [Rikenellaceae bacterium]